MSRIEKIKSLLTKTPGLNCNELEAALEGMGIPGDPSGTLTWMITKGTLVRGKARRDGEKAVWVYYINEEAKPQIPLPLHHPKQEHKEAAPAVRDITITIPVNERDTLTLTAAQFRLLREQLNGIGL